MRGSALMGPLPSLVVLRMCWGAAQALGPESKNPASMCKRGDPPEGEDDGGAESRAITDSPPVRTTQTPKRRLDRPGTGNPHGGLPR
ncbi:hypothetical protein GCM10022402_26980 [Salinactinospora qingdaonensis]|uniref:Uncharacterized protein n=1 Tax=Salinactinospora qingdaonensis TaxID=702744 RepID=A0ABP7FRT5_9ACTN